MSQSVRRLLRWRGRAIGRAYEGESVDASAPGSGERALLYIGPLHEGAAPRPWKRCALVKLMPRPTRRFHLPSALRPSSLRIDAAAAGSLVAGGALLVDCRRKDDVAHPLEGATRVPPDEIPAFAATLPPGVEVVLACT